MSIRGRRHALTTGIIAGTMVLAACSDSDTTTIAGDSAALPIGGQAQTTSAPAAAHWLANDYTLADDVDAMGGHRTAYRMVGSDDQLDTLARRLDVDLNEFDVDESDAILQSDNAIQWGYRHPRLEPRVGSETCNPDGTCAEPDPPADGIGADDAEAIVRDLLDGIGPSLDGAVLNVEYRFDLWTVHVAYVVDGLHAGALRASVSVTPTGEFVGATGYAGEIEAVGDHATVDTAVAVERMNDGWATVNDGMPFSPPFRPPDALDPPETTVPSTSGGHEPVTTTTWTPTPIDDEPGSTPPGTPNELATTTTISVPPGPDGTDPGSPPPVPPPSTRLEPTPVTLTGVEWGLAPVMSWDRSGLYLVPAYRFDGDDGATHVTVALREESIAPPDTTVPSHTVPPTMTTATAPPPPPPTDIPPPPPPPTDLPTSQTTGPPTTTG